MLTLDRVYQAAHTLNGIVRKTDLILSQNIAPDCELYLKAENLQVTGSFKIRGAYFKMASLSEDEKLSGVIACSAGNHAQGVALSAQRLGISATIFIPSLAPISKIEATKRMGAQIRLIDGLYDDAYDASCEFRQESGGVFIHPFDDPDVIAGQGTIGLELLEQISDFDAVIVPIGGGGLISGVAFTIKMLNPTCKVYGVQAVGAGSMYSSFKDNKRGSLANVSTFADGIAVKSPGINTYEICTQYVDEIVTVSDDEIATAILTLMEQQKLVAEGAGATAVAAAMFNKLPLNGKKVCAIVSGGNIDVSILSRVINRGLRTTGRLSELAIEMLDKPGQLREVSAIIADLGANVTKVIHNPGGENTDINGCFLHISMETKNKSHFLDIKQAIQKAGYAISEEGAFGNA
ncbi:MAG: threonine ammonia-lyase [Oscillospiraceae bacterium]|jgi:threonine dehydratase|nr:threonine ammonia-lyase [Oscillospiraceae bacterium]